MRILIYSPAFFPKVGGLEAIMSMLAHQFVKNGHEVKLISTTKDDTNTTFPFEVIRNPGFWQFLKLLKWCDTYFQGCVSLKGLFPFLFCPKPLVISHQTWYGDSETNQKGFKDKIKVWVCNYALNIAASKAVADRLPEGKGKYVIYNSYEDTLFKLKDELRDRNLVFLGRLVSDKGADLLLKSLGQLKAKHMYPSLTIIGSGEEEDKLRDMAIEYGINDQITFAGVQRGEALVSILNQHQIMVVPSRWNEPFGIVALEGMACGCVVIGSDKGGLKEAIGENGLTFPNNNVDKLTESLHYLLSNETVCNQIRDKSLAGLKNFSQEHIAKAYLKIMFPEKASKIN